MSRKSEA